MNAPHAQSRLRQRGIATVIVVLFLITAVIFALTQTLNISGSNSIDNKQQLDSVAALFLAESGLERARAIVTSAASGGTMTGNQCSDINDGVTYTPTVGRGNFKYVSATPTPNVSCTGANCTGCIVQVTGNVLTGNAVTASRTLSLDINMTSDNGKSGFGTTVTMKLKNTFNVPATAVFNMAWRRQGGTAGEVVVGGNAVATTSAGCTLRWNDESSSGSPSGGSMGASCDIGASPATVDVTQTIDVDRNYAIVGALFPGLTGAPIKIHSYWNDGGGGSGTKTVNNTSTSPSTGQTNSGVATSDLGPCVTPNPAATGTSQTCTSWCNGGDTLVFGVSARSTTFADEITAVTFNTNGSPSQNISMAPTRGDRVAHYPNTSGSPVSTGDIYSEIWYAHNSNLPNVSAGSFVVNETYVITTLGTTDFTLIGAASNTVASTFVATGAGTGSGTATPLTLSKLSSYKGNGIAAIGATFTGRVDNGTAGNPGTTLTVTVAPVGYPATIISPAFAGPPAYTGDTLSSSGGGGPSANVSGNPSITSQLTSAESGGALGGRGTYQIGGGNQDVALRAMTASSSILHVTACTICFFAPSDPVQGTAFTISSQSSGTTGGVGDYLLSGTPAIGTTAVSGTSQAGTAGTTLYLPSSPAPSIPAVTVPQTIIAVRAGTGVFAANTTTTVTAINADPNLATKSFEISIAPGTPLSLATICAGTCAFFDNPASTSSTTEFQVTRTGGTDQWAGGFTCLSGVDKSKILPIVSSTTTASTWRESVQ